MCVECKKQVKPGDNRDKWNHLKIRNIYVDFFPPLSRHKHSRRIGNSPSEDERRMQWKSRDFLQWWWGGNPPPPKKILVVSHVKPLSNEYMVPSQNQWENTQGTYRERTKSRNYRIQPCWALYIYCGKCWCKGAEHTAWEITLRVT